MENTFRLYDTLVKVLRQHENWLDCRHLCTLAWMIVGLIQSATVSLTAWVPYVLGRARFAQSTQRRFARWLNNPRIEVHSLYAPLIQKALTCWGEHLLYLALDTSVLFNRYCLIRLALVYRGRAVPLVWKVIEQPSASVGFSEYALLLSQAATLLPQGVKVVFLADRGFADTGLMAYVRQLGWHFRIRIKANFWVYRTGQPRCQVKHFYLLPGQAFFFENVYLTEKMYGRVYLALAHHSTTGERWYVVSSEPTEAQTFIEYGLRFDIEENFLDDKSNGFQLESSAIRRADALERLGFVLAMATLFLVSTGTQVVAEGKRRWVDPHWFRGLSYLRIGWQWVKSALVNGWQLYKNLVLTGDPDPEPAMASVKQAALVGTNRLNTSYCYNST